MELSELREAAKAEGDGTQFSELLTTHVQEQVSQTTAELRAELETTKGSVTKLEGKKEELLDEVKPFKRFLKDRELDGLEALEAQLDSKAATADPADLVELRKQLGMATTKLEREQEEKKAAKDAKAEAERVAAARLVERDEAALDYLLMQATTGTDGKGKPRPKAIDELRPYAKRHFLQFGRFKDFPQPDGSVKRSWVSEHQGDQIVLADGPASFDDLVSMAATGDGKKPWHAGGTRFFESNGSGRGGNRSRPGTPGAPISPEDVRKVQSLDEYEEVRPQLMK